MASAASVPGRKLFLELPKVPGFLLRLWINQEATEAFLALEEYPSTFDINKIHQIILDAIKKKLCHGLNEEFLNVKLPILLAKRIAFDEQLIASGQSAEPGTHARLDFRIPPATGQYTMRKDGTCDFKNRDLFRSVQENEIILKKFPARPGKPGMSVFGKLLPPPAVREIAVTLGKNVSQVEQDGVITVISNSSGKVVYNQGAASLNVQITPVMEIHGNVDYSTGNIFFKGSLEIKGSVLSGFSVVATGNIIIHGTVEAQAKVTAGGDLQVRKGIIGTGQHTPEAGMVKAFGNIHAQYAENATLTAEGDISLRSAMGCQIRTNGTLFVEKNLFGGEAVAFNAIVAGEIGNVMGIKTLLRVGVSHSTFNRLNLMIKIVNDLKKQLEKVEKDLEFVNTMGDALPPLKRVELHDLLAQKVRNLQEQIMKLEMKKADATLELLEENQATISGTIFHAGGMLFIRSSKMAIDREFRMASFYQKLPEETIESMPYLPSNKGKTKAGGRTSF